jgi:hypothetical protein
MDIANSLKFSEITRSVIDPSTTSEKILDADKNREFLRIVNLSGKDMYVSEGEAVGDVTEYAYSFKVPNGSMYEPNVRVFAGELHAKFESGTTGKAIVTTGKA